MHPRSSPPTVTSPLTSPAAASPALVQVLLPSLALLTLSAVLMGAGGDMWLADRLYAWQGGHWALRDAWWTSSFLHRGGRNASVALGMLAIIGCLLTWRRPRWATQHRALLYLVLAVALSTGLVSLLKSISNMDCPWDLVRYGGDRAFVGLLSVRPDGMPRGVCFPGGHSSAGYAWVALYFAARLWRPRWALPALLAGLCAGLLFGLAQQLRGAHFASHDLWTLGICWFTALALFQPFSRRTAASTPDTQTGARA